jgi:methylaspartate mutase epsilon subunit
MAYYTEHGGIPLLAGVPGILNGWDAAGFKIVNIILQSLLCVEQGVRRISVNPSPCMNLIQDVAVFRALRRLVPEYLSRFGHPDVEVSTISMTWQGDWPRDRERAGAVVAWCVAMGALAGVSAIRLKSVGEAFATPAKEGWVSSIKIARQVLQIVGNQRLPEFPELLLEQEMLEKEARATVDKVIELGDGDVAVGMVRGVDAGVLDTFLSPWRPLKQNVIVVRDNEGAARYLKHGAIPLPKEVVEYHREKINHREKAENMEADLKMLIRDVTRISAEVF